MLDLPRRDRAMPEAVAVAVVLAVATLVTRPRRVTNGSTGFASVVDALCGRVAEPLAACLGRPAGEEAVAGAEHFAPLGVTPSPSVPAAATATPSRQRLEKLFGMRNDNMSASIQLGIGIRRPTVQAIPLPRLRTRRRRRSSRSVRISA